VCGELLDHAPGAAACSSRELPPGGAQCSGQSWLQASSTPSPAGPTSKSMAGAAARGFAAPVPRRERRRNQGELLSTAVLLRILGGAGGRPAACKGRRLGMGEVGEAVWGWGSRELGFVVFCWASIFWVVQCWA
jgi:hypothetical protein